MSEATRVRTDLAAKKRVLLARLLKQRGIGDAAEDTIVRADANDLHLSFAQQRLWFLDKLEPDSPRYNIFGAFRLQGTLHTEALARSLEEVVRRHDALRSRFVEVDGDPQLQIVPPAPFPLATEDLRALAPAEQTAEVSRLSLEAARRPFELAARSEEHTSELQSQ